MKIKYYFLSMALAAVALAGFTACSDDDDPVAAPETPEMQLPDETVRVRIGDEYRVPVASIPLVGGGDYSAYSLAPDVCDIEADEDGTLYLAGYKNGTADVVFTDAAGNIKRMKVAVYTTDNMTLNYSRLEMTTPLNALNRVNGLAVAEGNGKYSATSDDERIEVSIDELTGALSIVAAAEEQPYTGVVTVRDQTDLEAQLTVTVSLSTDRVKIGADTRVKVPTDPSLGEATVECISSATATIVEGADGYYVEGLANGLAYVNICQGDLFRQLTYSIYTTDVMTLSHTEFNFVTPMGNSSSNSECSVLLGNGGYSCSSDNDKVSASIDNNTGVITLTATSAKDPFTAHITVTDCTALTATIEVTVTATFDPFTAAELAELAAKSANEAYINSYQFDEHMNSEIASGAWYWGTWTDSSDGTNHTFGWWDKAWSDYGGHYIIYPAGTGLNTEVTATYQFMSYRGQPTYNLTGTAKVLRDDSTAKVVIWWNVDMDNECIERGWIVRKK